MTRYLVALQPVTVGSTPNVLLTSDAPKRYRIVEGLAHIVPLNRQGDTVGSFTAESLLRSYPANYRIENSPIDIPAPSAKIEPTMTPSPAPTPAAAPVAAAPKLTFLEQLCLDIVMDTAQLAPAIVPLVTSSKKAAIIAAASPNLFTAIMNQLQAQAH